MNRKSMIVASMAGMALAAMAQADTTLIDFDIQSDRVDGFMFSLLHTASSDDNQGGEIVAMLDGTFRGRLDDHNTADLSDDTLEIIAFDGVLTRHDDDDDDDDDDDHGRRMGTLTLNGPSLFSPTQDRVDSVVGGNLDLRIAFGNRGANINFGFEASNIMSLPNHLFRPGADMPGNGELDDNEYGIALWGMGDVQRDGRHDDDDHRRVLGMDLVGLGTVVPAPGTAALALIGLGLGVSRRRA